MSETAAALIGIAFGLFLAWYANRRDKKGRGE